MPNYNSTIPDCLLTGTAGDGSVVAVSGGVIAGPSAGGEQWLNPDEAVCQRYDATHSPQLVAVHRETKAQRVLYDGGVNDFVAGGNRVLVVAVTGAVLLLDRDGKTLADLTGKVAPIAAAADGTLAYKVWNLDGLLICPPGAVPNADIDAVLEPSNVPVRGGDLCVVRLGCYVWQASGRVKAIGLPTPMVLPGALAWLWAGQAPDGRWWIAYQHEASGRVVFHPVDSLTGFAWDAPVAFRISGSFLTGHALLAWATRDGDQPAAIVEVDASRELPINLGALQPPVPPASQPTPTPTPKPPAPPTPTPTPKPQPAPMPAPLHEDSMPELTPDQKNEVCDALGAIALRAFGGRSLAESSQGVRQALDQDVTDPAWLAILSLARDKGATTDEVERAAKAGRLLQGR